MKCNKAITEIHERALERISEVMIELQDQTAGVGEIPRKFESWSEDDGPVLWWDVSMTSGEITEPPEYIGSPLSSDWIWEDEDSRDLLWVPLPKLARSKP